MKVRNYGKWMEEKLSEVRGIVRDYVRMRNIKRASVMELGQLITKPEGRSEYLHEEEIWGEDPVHMTPTGYKLAAEGLEATIYEKRREEREVEEKQEQRPAKKPRVDPALSRPDWVRGNVSEAVRLDGRGQMGPPQQRKKATGEGAAEDRAVIAGRSTPTDSSSLEDVVPVEAEARMEAAGQGEAADPSVAADPSAAAGPTGAAAAGLGENGLSGTSTGTNAVPMRN